ncbi:hypothetical protein ACQP3J_33380, partial [Escherichia coli]
VQDQPGLLRKSRSVFSRDAAPDRLHMLWWIAPHPLTCPISMYIPETLIRLSVFYFFEEHMELGGGMLRGSYMESWRQEVEAGM